MTTDHPGTTSSDGAPHSGEPGRILRSLEDRIFAAPATDLGVTRPARSGMDRVLPWLILATGLGLSVTASLWVHRARVEDASMQFQVAAGEQIQRVKRELDVALESVRPLALLFASSEHVEREEFHRFANEILQRQASLEAVAWLPHVLHGDRAAFEKARQDQGVKGFMIVDADVSSVYERASDRADYYPIDYIEPWEVNLPVVGADLGINRSPSTALVRALESSEATVSGPIRLPWVAGTPRGVLTFIRAAGPTRQGAGPGGSSDQSGVVMGVFNVSKLLEHSFPPGMTKSLKLSVNDVALENQLEPFYMSPASEPAATEGQLHFRQERVNVGGRTWVVTATPVEPGTTTKFGGDAWGVLVGGAVGSTLLAGFLFSRIGRAQAHRELRALTTDLREANATLVESRQRVQSIFDAAIDPLWDWDVVTNTSVLSPSWKRLLGYGPDEEIGEPTSWSGRVHPEDYPVAMAALKRCVDGGTDLYEAEYRLRSKSGAWIRVLSRGRVVTRDARGRALRMIGNMTDISSIVAAKEALAASQERFQQIADNIDQVFWMLSLEVGRLLYVSPGVERIWGRTASEFCEDRTQWLQSVHPDDRDMAEEAGAQWLATGGKGSYESIYRIIRPDGGVRWIHDRGSSVRDASGAIYRIVGVAADVTARIKTEAALAESEELRRAMVEQAAMGIVQIELDGRFAIANQRACEILGYSEAELRTRNVRDITHPEDLPRNLELLGALFRGEVPSFTMEKRYIGGIDRKVIWVNVAVSLVRDESGVPRYFITVLEDISQRKVAELALRESEATNRALLEAVPDHLFRMDREGRYLAYHTRDESRLAARPSEFIGRKVDDVLPGQRAETCMSALRDLFATGQPQTYEYDYDSGRDGKRYYEVRVVRCGHDEAMLVVRDISARKLAEISLQESEKRYRDLMEILPISVLVHQDGKIAYGNRASAQLIGQESPSVITGREFLSVVRQEDREEAAMRIQEALASGDLLPTSRMRVCGDDGEERAVETTSTRIVFNHQPAVLTVATDITARLRSEGLLRQAQSRLSAVLDRMPDVVLYDSHPEGKYISENVTNLLGYPAASFVEDRTLFGRLVHAEDAAEVEAQMRELLESHASRSLTLQFRVRRADGSQIWLEDRMVSHETPTNTWRVTGVLIDITERKRAEQRQRLMVAELDHRVKNNLAAVLSLAEQSMRTTASAQEFYTVFVNRVRALARLHGALAHSHWQHINLRSIVEQTLAAFHTSSSSEVILEGKDVLLPGRIGSPLALTLHELATNAVKHGSLSSLTGSLAISWEIQEAPGQRSLRMTWKESGGPTVATPVRRGLGRDLIEGGLAHELGGEVKLLFQPEGVMCEIVVPIPTEPS